MMIKLHSGMDPEFQIVSWQERQTHISIAVGNVRGVMAENIELIHVHDCLSGRSNLLLQNFCKINQTCTGQKKYFQTCTEFGMRLILWLCSCAQDSNDI